MTGLLWWIKVGYKVFNQLGSLHSFRLVVEDKASKKLPESSRSEFLERFLRNNIGLSDAEDNTSGSFSSEGIAVLSYFARSHESQVSGRW